MLGFVKKALLALLCWQSLSDWANAASFTETPKLKILCLHGYLSNAQVFSTQLAPAVSQSVDCAEYGS
jgi:hypothetical protein